MMAKGNVRCAKAAGCLRPGTTPAIRPACPRCRCNPGSRPGASRPRDRAWPRSAGFIPLPQSTTIRRFAIKGRSSTLRSPRHHASLEKQSRFATCSTGNSGCTWMTNASTKNSLVCPRTRRSADGNAPHQPDRRRRR